MPTVLLIQTYILAKQLVVSSLARIRSLQNFLVLLVFYDFLLMFSKIFKRSCHN